MKQKKSLKFILAIAAMILMTIGLTSCVTPEYCEEHHTGDVIIYNECSYRVTVDVGSPDLPGDGFAGERSISPGGSVKYSNIPAGYIEIWEADLYSDWGYWDEYLNECETFEFEIYMGKGAVNESIHSGNIENKLKNDKK